MYRCTQLSYATQHGAVLIIIRLQSISWKSSKRGVGADSKHCTHARTHTHTHPFNDPLSGTTRVSRYQKGRTNLDFTEARDSGISWAICKSAPRSKRITMPAPHCSVFYRPDALPATQPTVSKHWRQNSKHCINSKLLTVHKWPVTSLYHLWGHRSIWLLCSCTLSDF